MTSGGSPLDNSVAESFFATLKRELVDRYSWPTRADLPVAIFEWIEVFYNRQRLTRRSATMRRRSLRISPSQIKRKRLESKPETVHESGSGPENQVLHAFAAAPITCANRYASSRPAHSRSRNSYF